MKTLLIAAALAGSIGTAQAFTHDFAIQYCADISNMAYVGQKARIAGTTIGELEAAAARSTKYTDEEVDTLFMVLKVMREIDSELLLYPRGMQKAFYAECEARVLPGVTDTSYDGNI